MGERKKVKHVEAAAGQDEAGNRDSDETLKVSMEKEHKKVEA